MYDYEAFWDTIQTGDHLLQVYEDREIFLHALTAYTASALKNNDGVILIAEEQNRKAVEARLSGWFNISMLKQRENFLVFDAEEMLNVFFINNRIDEYRFREAACSIVANVSKTSGRARVFGEMSSLLWKRGHTEASLKLEHMWESLCQSGLISLYCAFPKKIINDTDSYNKICRCHSKLVEQPASGAALYNDRLIISSLQHSA